MTNLCRVLLIEDDLPVRNRLAHIIEDWKKAELLAACSNLKDGLAIIQNQNVDVLVTDLKLPDGNGIDAIRTLRKAQPQANAMVISALGDSKTVIAAIEAGATGFLLKDAEPYDVIDAITKILEGGSPVSSAIARTIIRQLNAPPAQEEETEPSMGLTPRELEILQGLAKGLTSVEIAEMFAISKQTVSVHIRNIYRKMEVRNRTEAAYEALRLGLVNI